MALKIDGSTLFNRRILTVNNKGVFFADTSLAGGRRFRFDQIDFIYRSADPPDQQFVRGWKPEIAFQVGVELFSVPYNPNRKQHVDTINTLVQEVCKANQRSC